MAPIDPGAAFRRAERAFAERRFADARAALTAILPLVGEHPAVLHLLALIEKGDGRTDAAAIAFRRALAVAPGDVQIRNNYANLLIAQDRLDDALAEFDRVIGAQPAMVEARINRAIVRQRLGQAEAAWAEIEPIARQHPANARVLSVAASIAQDCGDLDRAEALYDRALNADPGRATALAGRARVALERGDADAETRYDRAIAHQPADRWLALSRTNAVEAAGDGARAIGMLTDMVAADPFWTAGQDQLVRMRSEAGDEDPFTVYRAAAARPDAPVDLVRGYLGALSQAGRDAEIASHPAAASDDDILRILTAAALSNLRDERADAAVEAVARLPGAEVTAARHWLRRGQPERVCTMLEPRAAAEPDDVAQWAYLGLAWRMLSDPRADWLYGDPALYGTTALDLTPDQLSALADLLRRLHRARAHPIGQSMRGGTQTRGNLLRRREPLLAMLAHRLNDAVARHVAALPPADARHPLLRLRERRFAITGSWSVRLSSSGFHVSHIHPAGVLSSALYIALPGGLATDAPQAGWLELGRPPADLSLPLKPLALVEPQPGRLALFPSYMFHGTRPFADGERLTVAFDVTAR